MNLPNNSLGFKPSKRGRLRSRKNDQLFEMGYSKRFSVFIMITMCFIQCACAKQIYDHGSSFRDKADYSGFAASKSEFFDRFRREANLLGSTVSNLESLARISSGVALEIGLRDGKITPDSAISDLLRLGTLTPTSIINLDNTAIDNALKELEALPGLLKSGDDVKKMEERLVLLVDVKENSAFADKFADFPGKDDYLTKLNELVNINKVNQFAELKQSVESISSTLRDFKNYATPLSNNDASEVASLTPALVTYFERLERITTKNLADIVNTINSADDIVKKSSFFQLLVLEDDVRRKFTDKVAQDEQQLLTDNYNTVKSSAENLKSSKVHFDAIHSFLKSRDSSFRHTFQVSAGLPRGTADLDALEVDCENNWIKERMINGSATSSSLKTAFKSLDNLNGDLKSVEKSWEALLSKSSSKSVLKVIEAQLGILNLGSEANIITGKIKEFLNCDKNRGTPTLAPGVLSLFRGQITDLNTEVTELKSFRVLEDIRNLAVLSDLKKIIKKAGSIDETKAPGLINDLRAAKLDSTTNQLEKVKNDLDALAIKLTAVSTKASTFANSFNKITSYHNEIETQALGFYKCLRKIDDSGSAAVRSIEKIKNIRIDSTVINEAKSTINEILNSKDTLTSAINAAGELKNVKIPEVVSLDKAFGEIDYKEKTKKLGLGVQGLSAIEKLIKSKGALQPLLDKIDEIFGVASLSALSQSHLDNLGKVKELNNVFGNIETFLKSAGLQASRRRKRNSKFVGEKKFLTGAVVVKGVNIDTSLLREALGFVQAAQKSQQVDPTKYDDAVTASNTLDNLVLDFGNFGFNEAGDSLTDIDTFFASYTKTILALPPPQQTISNPAPGVGNSAQSSPSLDASSAKVEEKPWYTWFEEHLILTIIIVIAIPTVVGLVITAICFYLKKRKTPDPPDDIVIPTTDPNANKNPKPNTDSDAKNEPKPNPIPEPKPDPKPEPKPEPTPDPKPDPAKNSTDSATGNGSNVELKESAKDVDPVAPLVNTAGTATTSVLRSLHLQKTQYGSVLEVLKMIVNAVDAIEHHMAEFYTVKHWADTILQSQNTQDKALVTGHDEKHLSERRYKKYYCKPDTMAKIAGYEDNPFINCNEMPLKEKSIFMAQGVLTGLEPDDDGPKKDARGKHYALLDHNDIKIIVQLCKFEEGGCGLYYRLDAENSLEFDNYTVTTVSVEEELPNHFEEKKMHTLYHLEYTHKVTKNKKKVDVLLYKGWPDKKAPVKAESILEIIKFCNTYNSNILVHCSAGIGRTGTLVAIMHGLEKCQSQTVNSISEIIQDVRRYRFGAVQTAEQVIYILLTITKGIMNDYKISYLPEYCKLSHWHKCCSSSTYDQMDDYAKRRKKSGKPNAEEREFMENEIELINKLCADMKAEDEERMKEKQEDDGAGKTPDVKKNDEKGKKADSKKSKAKSSEESKVKKPSDDEGKKKSTATSAEMKQELKPSGDKATGEKKKAGADEKPKEKPTSSAAPEKKRKDGSKKSQVKPTAEKKDIASKPITSKNESKSAKTKIKTKK